jgi:hypothetical protein
VYRKADLKPVGELAREIDAQILFTLYRTGAGDEEVEALVKKHRLLGVVANRRRFTPWLASRLHAIDTPILVHTVNDHDEVFNMTQAGADGFFTDSYVPYDRALSTPAALAACGKTEPSDDDLSPWVRRDVMVKGDYKLAKCAKRRQDRVELSGCGQRPAIRGPYLAVPSKRQLHVELDVGTGDKRAEVWLDVVHKHGPKRVRPKETISLAPGERRRIELDVQLEQGSPGVETRVGLGKDSGPVAIHALRAEQRSLEP